MRPRAPLGLGLCLALLTATTPAAAGPSRVWRSGSARNSTVAPGTDGITYPRYRGVASGNGSVSRMLRPVMSMTTRSTPTPRPPVGGMAYSIAARKSS